MGSRILIAVVIIALTGAYASELRSSRVSSHQLPELRNLPRELAGWTGEDVVISDVEARVLSADVMLHRRYRREDGAEVWLFAAYFAKQQVNSQIHSPKNCVPGGGWQLRSSGTETVTLPDGRSQPVTRMTVARKGKTSHVYYWFQTRAGVVTGEYALKWDLVKSSLARRPTDAVFVRYNCGVENADAATELMALLKEPLSGILHEVGLP